MLTSPHGIYNFKQAKKILKPGVIFWTIKYLSGKGVVDIQRIRIWDMRTERFSGYNEVVLLTRKNGSWLLNFDILTSLCHPTAGIFLKRRDAVRHYLDCKKYFRTKKGRSELADERRRMLLLPILDYGPEMMDPF